MKKNSLLSRYTGDTSGNITIMSVAVFPVMLALIGTAISIVDVQNRQSKLQNHTDSMSLMMAKLKKDFTGVEARGAYLVYINSDLREGESCDFKLRKRRGGATTATLNCNGQVDTFLPEFTGLGSLTYSTSATATNSSDIYEIAFVFDISDSMAGDEMEELRVTLDEFNKSVLFDHSDSRVSLIPFANTVRLGDRFEQFVDPATGYDVTNGAYTGCFDREATDPTINIKTTSGYPLVNYAIASGREVCPNEDMTAIFHKTTSDWEVKDLPGNIDLAFGTGLSDGLVWGFRSLDPDLRGLLSDDSRYPLQNNINTSKHVIMMTDGRPYDRPYVGPGGGDVTKQRSLERFKTVCSQLEFDQKEISFHLINFNNKNLPDETLEIYKNCVKGEGQYYEAKSGELSDIIDLIASKVSTLRISN